MSRIQFQQGAILPDEGVPVHGLMNLCREYAEAYLEERGFFEYLGAAHLSLDGVVVDMPFSVDRIHDVGGAEDVGRALGAAIWQAASRVAGFDPSQSKGATQADVDQAVLSAPGVGPVHWDQIQRVRKSQAGAVTGVYFVETPQGTVVIKPSKYVGNEAFALALAREMGIATPDFGLVPIGSGETQQLMRSQDAQGWDSLYDVIVPKTDEHVLAMSLVEGYNLLEMGRPQAEEVFGGPGGPERYRELGVLAALDMITKNDDRFPLDGGVGNAGNIMFRASDGKVVAIDQMVVASSRHYGAVATFAQELAEAPDKACPLAQRIKGMIRMFTGVDGGEAADLAIHQGILTGLRKLLTLDKARLERMKQELGGAAVRDMDSVNVDAICELLEDALRRHAGAALGA